MASLTARQQAFVQRHSTIQPFWGEVEDVSILGAALLTLGINPSALDDELEACAERASLEDLPDDFLPRIEVLCSAIRVGSLRPVALKYNRHQSIDENETRVRTSDFADWCDGKGIPHNLPVRPTPQPQSKWPWGKHSTPLLDKLAVAAEEWWSDFDPKNPSAAPTNAEVAKWLVDQGVAKRVAEVMAQILRADGLPPGPKK